MKTGAEIEQLVFDLARNSGMTISGAVYKSGVRPSGSMKEDIVVSFLTGKAGVIQEGIVNVNFYVKDIAVSAGGILQRDSRRTTEIELMAMDWVKSINVTDCYLFTISDMIQTLKSEIMDWHVVNVRLQFKIINK